MPTCHPVLPEDPGALGFAFGIPDPGHLPVPCEHSPLCDSALSFPKKQSWHCEPNCRKEPLGTRGQGGNEELMTSAWQASGPPCGSCRPPEITWSSLQRWGWLRGHLCPVGRPSAVPLGMLIHPHGRRAAFQLVHLWFGDPLRKSRPDAHCGCVMALPV